MRANSSADDILFGTRPPPLSIDPGNHTLYKSSMFLSRVRMAHSSFAWDLATTEVQPGVGIRCPMFHCLPRRVRLSLPLRHLLPPPPWYRSFLRASSTSGMAGGVCGARVVEMVVL